MKTTTPVAAVSYKNLISKSQTQLEAEDLDLKVQEAKSSLEVTVATTKRDLSVAKRNLAKTQSASPYNVQNELAASQEVASLEEGLAFAEKVLAERF